MSMSSISGAIVGAYVQMIPGELVLTAIPLNIINAIIVY
jgi:purine nucleoside transport protein